MRRGRGLLTPFVSLLQVWVSASGSPALGNPSLNDTIYISIGFHSGIIAGIHVSWCDPIKLRKVAAVGSCQRIDFDDMNTQEPIRISNKGVAATFNEAQAQDSMGWNTPSQKLTISDGDVLIPKIKPTEPLKSQFEKFMSHVTDANFSRCSPENDMGVSVVRVLEAAVKSIATGNKVLLSDIPYAPILSAGTTRTVVIIGHGSMAARCLKSIISLPGVRVPLCIADASDSGEDTWRESFAKAAREAGYVDGESLLLCKFPHDEDALTKLRALKPTLLLSLQCQKIIREQVIECAELGCVNCHNAPLPLLRGCDPFAWALHDGLLQMGVTLHQVPKSGVDDGPILTQQLWPINNDTTAFDLYERSLEVAEKLVCASLLPILNGEIVPKPQNPSAVSYHPANCFPYEPLGIAWNLPAVTASALARARTFPPFQLPTFSYDGQTVEVARLKACARPRPGKVGEILSAEPLIVNTRREAINVLEVRLDGVITPVSEYVVRQVLGLREGIVLS